jgi:heme/copper-type cytochrome/quinol oxidase subunit 2
MSDNTSSILQGIMIVASVFGVCVYAQFWIYFFKSRRRLRKEYGETASKYSSDKSIVIMGLCMTPIVVIFILFLIYGPPIK